MDEDVDVDISTAVTGHGRRTDADGRRERPIEAVRSVALTHRQTDGDRDESDARDRRHDNQRHDQAELADRQRRRRAVVGGRRSAGYGARARADVTRFERAVDGPTTCDARALVPATLAARRRPA